MRESIGVSYIFTIFIVFIMLFTAYLAVSVNYSKAFKIKSYIVSQIEENNGFSREVNDDISMYLTSQGYTAYGDCPKIKDSSWQIDDSNSIDTWAPTGQKNVCVYSLDVSKDADNDDINKDKKYYKVVTFFKFDLPIINNTLTFKISGDTQLITPK